MSLSDVKAIQISSLSVTSFTQQPWLVEIFMTIPGETQRKDTAHGCCFTPFPPAISLSPIIAITSLPSFYFH